MVAFLSLLLNTAHADVVIDKVQVAADKRITFDVTVSGARLNIVVGEVPAKLTRDSLELSVARYGDIITAVAIEDGSPTGQLEIFGPENGVYHRLTPKPITARSANLNDGDVESAVGKGHPEAELARIVAYYTANPDRPLSVWMRRLERERYKPMPLPVAQMPAPKPTPATDPATPAVQAKDQSEICLGTIDDDCTPTPATLPPVKFEAKRRGGTFRW